MKPAVWLVALSVLSLLPRLLRSQPCSRSGLTDAVRDAKSIRAQLLLYKVGYHGTDESVPPALQAQIAAYKDALATIASAELKCTPPRVEASTVEMEVARLIDANKRQADQPYDPNDTRKEIDEIYGWDPGVKVSRPGNAPGLLLIEFEFGIDCGYDAMLLGFEVQGSEWVRVLRWQSGNYDSVDAAFGDFFKYLVLAGTRGQWQIAVAHGHPWCTSNISAFDVDLIRPAVNGEPQRVLAHEQRIYRREEDPVMKAVPGGFEFRMIGDSIDPLIVMRPVIYRFAVDSGQMTRVQPLANNGRDFVDEWLQSPWNEASRWSDAESLDLLKAEHDLVSKRYSSQDAPLQDFGPVRGCTDSPSHFQVEFDTKWLDEKGKAIRAEEAYFQIAEGKNSFTMLSASNTPDAHCTGRDIMPPN